MSINKTTLAPIVIGAVLALGLGLCATTAWPELSVIAGYGAAIGALVGLQVRHWVPFQFKHTVPADPIPTVFDNSVAPEDGSSLSNTRLAKVFALLMGAALVALFVLIIFSGGAPSWSAVRPV